MQIVGVLLRDNTAERPAKRFVLQSNPSDLPASLLQPFNKMVRVPAKANEVPARVVVLQYKVFAPPNGGCEEPERGSALPVKGGGPLESPTQELD
jgi:hypothetical protein